MHQTYWIENLFRFRPPILSSSRMHQSGLGSADGSTRLALDARQLSVWRKRRYEVWDEGSTYRKGGRDFSVMR